MPDYSGGVGEPKPRHFKSKVSGFNVNCDMALYVKEMNERFLRFAQKSLSLLFTLRSLFNSMR
jgi:hypothetical protein